MTHCLMNCWSVRIEKCQTDGNGEKQWAVRSPSPPMGGVTKACRPTVGLHTIPHHPPLTPLLLLSHPPAPNCRRGKGLQMIIWSAPSSRLLSSSWILPEFTFVSRFYHKRIKCTYIWSLWASSSPNMKCVGCCVPAELGPICEWFPS